jgi:hypothetical protein
MGEAALLPPLSTDESVLDSWAQAGWKFLASTTRNLEDIESLPEWLYRKITDSTSAPSLRRKKTVITSELKKGFKSFARETTITEGSG